MRVAVSLMNLDTVQSLSVFTLRTDGCHFVGLPRASSVILVSRWVLDSTETNVKGYPWHCKTANNKDLWLAVETFVDRAQFAVGDVGINLGGGDITMAKQELHRA